MIARTSINWMGHPDRKVSSEFMKRDTYEISPHIAILETTNKNSLSEGAMAKVT